MAFPLVNLNTATHLAIHWGWFSVTLGNLVAYVAVVAVLVLGMFVRTRGGRRDVEEVERRNLRGVLDPERTSAKGEQP